MLAKLASSSFGFFLHGLPICHAARRCTKAVTHISHIGRALAVCGSQGEGKGLLESLLWGLVFMPLALAHFDAFDCYNRLQSINIFYSFSFSH